MQLREFNGRWCNRILKEGGTQRAESFDGASAPSAAGVQRVHGAEGPQFLASLPRTLPPGGGGGKREASTLPSERNEHADTRSAGGLRKGLLLAALVESGTAATYTLAQPSTATPAYQLLANLSRPLACVLLPLLQCLLEAVDMRQRARPAADAPSRSPSSAGPGSAVATARGTRGSAG